MAKELIQYNGEILDSTEEKWMAMWLEEMKHAGFIQMWCRVHQPTKIFEACKYYYTKTTVLKTKTKHEGKLFTLLNGLKYTPDFYVKWTDKALGTFVSHIGEEINPNSWFYVDNQELDGWIEVKPIFDQNGKTAKFSIIQKILWNTKEMFIDLIITEKLFEGTFMPKEAMDDFKYKKSPTGKNKGMKKVGDFKCDYKPKTLEEFLNGI